MKTKDIIYDVIETAKAKTTQSSSYIETRVQPVQQNEESVGCREATRTAKTLNDEDTSSNKQVRSERVSTDVNIEVMKVENTRSAESNEVASVRITDEKKEMEPTYTKSPHDEDLPEELSHMKREAVNQQTSDVEEITLVDALPMNTDSADVDERVDVQETTLMSALPTSIGSFDLDGEATILVGSLPAGTGSFVKLTDSSSGDQIVTLTTLGHIETTADLQNVTSQTEEYSNIQHSSDSKLKFTDRENRKDNLNHIKEVSEEKAKKITAKPKVDEPFPNEEDQVVRETENYFTLKDFLKRLVEEVQADVESLLGIKESTCGSVSKEKANFSSSIAHQPKENSHLHDKQFSDIAASKLYGQSTESLQMKTVLLDINDKLKKILSLLTVETMEKSTSTTTRKVHSEQTSFSQISCTSTSAEDLKDLMMQLIEAVRDDLQSAYEIKSKFKHKISTISLDSTLNTGKETHVASSQSSIALEKINSNEVANMLSNMIEEIRDEIMIADLERKIPEIVRSFGSNFASVNNSSEAIIEMLRTVFEEVSTRQPLTVDKSVSAPSTNFESISTGSHEITSESESISQGTVKLENRDSEGVKDVLFECLKKICTELSPTMSDSESMPESNTEERLAYKESLELAKSEDVQAVVSKVLSEVKHNLQTSPGERLVPFLKRYSEHKSKLDTETADSRKEHIDPVSSQTHPPKILPNYC